MSGLPEAQPGYRWELQVPGPPPRRRHAGRWIAAIVVLLILLAIAVVAAEWLAREVTTNSIRSAVVSELGLPPDQEVEVDLTGVVLLQLAKGTLDEVTITSDDVTLGAMTGDMTVHATGLPVRGDDAFSSASASIVLDEAQLR
ncbi:MAG TPA: LmeA family phospholipid-binding protein, partial [Microbacterium sp.]|nr:LmeA family phospholipid-binding protein [Microbacterium sp.]